MTNTTKTKTTSRTIGWTMIASMRMLLLGLTGLVIAGCGPSFDPASLITNTRVLGARIQVEGAPDRASPVPGETAKVTWLVTAPDVVPPLAWTFAACLPSTTEPNNLLGCFSAPLVRVDGTTSPPQISMQVPSATALGDATRVVVYGQLCAGAGSVPTFPAQNGLPGCSAGRGTTVSLDVPVQVGGDANHNPTADRAFTFDGVVWPASAAAADPCTVGPRVTAGSADHVIGNTTDGADREVYTMFVGEPPVAVPTREQLQISQFTTAGKLNGQFSFVEATDDRPMPTVDVTWDAPETGAVAANGTAVTFTFVTRDERGGADWTTRALCVTP